MKNTLFMAVSLIFFTLTVFCAKEPEATEFKIPENYRNWRQPAGRILEYTVPGHGSSARIIYANDLTYEYTVVPDGNSVRYSYPDGSIIIKEVYKDRASIGKTAPMLTVMVKNSKAPDAISGWLYYLKQSDAVPMEISSKMCVGCHEAANDTHPYFDKNPDAEFRDFLFVKPEK